MLDEVVDGGDAVVADDEVLWPSLTVVIDDRDVVVEVMVDVG